MYTNKCPNSDINFNKILDKLFGNHSVETRKKIFYLICITVRLFLYSLVYLYKDSKFIPYLLSIFSAFSIYHLYSDIKNNVNNNRQWWSKKFEFIISILVFISSLTLIIQRVNGISKENQISTSIAPILLFISLFTGIFQSFFITFC
jgi:hypothetical protein